MILNFNFKNFFNFIVLANFFATAAYADRPLVSQPIQGHSSEEFKDQELKGLDDQINKLNNQIEAEKFKIAELESKRAKLTGSSDPGTCAALTDAMRASDYYKCTTSQGVIVEYDKDQGDYPYTINGMHLSKILGKRDNGTEDHNNYQSIKPGETDELGQQIVGDDSPAVQLCKEHDGKLLTEPQQERILQAFGKGTEIWLTNAKDQSSKRSTPKLTETEIKEMHAAIPDSGVWTWSSSVHPSLPYGALDLDSIYGNIDGGYRYNSDSVRCVRP